MERHEWNVRFRTAEEKAATVRRLKAFAATNGLSMPDALERLLMIADLAAADDRYDQKQSGTRPDSIIAGDAEIVGDQQVHW